MLLYLIRHGETEMNDADIGNGQLDDKLSEVGFKQAQLLGEKCRTVTFSQIRASDLSRAYKTAQAIADQQPKPIVVQQDQRLRERSFGDYEGKPLQILRDKAHAAGYDKISDYYQKEPSIETGESMMKRYNAWFQEHIEGEGCIAIVTHGGMIREIVSDLINRHNGEYFAVLAPISNTGVTIIELKPEKHIKRILTFNDYSHLRGIVEEKSHRPL